MTDVERFPAVANATFVLAGVGRSALLDDPTDTAPLDAHASLVASILEAHGGVCSDRTPRDEVLAVFAQAADGVAAALAVQLRITGGNPVGDTPLGGPSVPVRIAVHATAVRESVTAAVRRSARLALIAHGGQTLLSAETARVVADLLPDEAWLVDLGTHRLHDLSRPEHLFELRHGDLATDLPPPRSLDATPNNLPSQLTSFVGREHELAEILTLLDDRRLVTLVGAGGCGKTRLALQAMAESMAASLGRWPDGVWWVDLGEVTDPALVVQAVASAVRVLVEPAGNPLLALVRLLTGHRLLICLDTCEHLLDPCAELVDTLLRNCPGVCVLVTSREVLSVPGETLWQVQPLPAHEAIRLFTERAALVQTGFTGDHDGPAIRAICDRLDGIPLAIELAAAWVRALSPGEISSRLDDRFHLLVGGPRVGVDRHRTLAASITWSYDLLDDNDQVLFRRLAVFAGGFTVAAARAVCMDPSMAEVQVLAAIGRLVDKSLVVVVEADEGARFRLLDTIREYAETQLRAAHESSGIRDRHLAYFLDVAETAEPQLERNQDHWRRVLETEHDNLRSALRWGLAAADPALGRRLAAAMARFWYVHGHIQEGLGFLQRAIDLAADERSTVQASLLSGAGLVAAGGARPAMAGDAAERGLAIADELGDHRNRGRCLVIMAYQLFFTDAVEMHRLALEAQRCGRDAGDPVAVDMGGVLVACAFTNRDRHEEAVMRARPLFERTSKRGERSWAALARGVEVHAALFTGDLRRAEELGRDALAIATPLGDYLTVGLVTVNLAWVMGLAGKIDDAQALIDPVVRAATAAGPEVELRRWFALMPATLHLWAGDLDSAVEWFDIAARFAERLPDNWVVARALRGLAEAKRRQGLHDEARVHADRALSVATKLDTPHIRAEAMDQLAFLAAAADDPARATDLHHQALSVRVAHNLRTFWADSLDALAGLAARAGHAAEAARLLAASDTARDGMGYPRPPVARPDHDAVVAGLRTALGDAVFLSTWAEGARLTPDEAIGYATRSRGPRQRPTTGWASLTPTELNVVEMVAAGASNPEIATRLFMSRSTVKAHLAHIYAKLDVANRTELATLAGKRHAPQ